MKRISVVGGGIFGATAAIFAARQGYEVHLFELRQQLLQAASGINQYRLHRGYHYPRSADTARSCREAEQSFRDEYAGALLTDVPHLYGIAKAQSKVSYKNYLSFCCANRLKHTAVELPQLINPNEADAIRVQEASIDPAALLTLVTKKLYESGVNVHLGVRCEQVTRDFDRTIIATYASMNSLLSDMGYPTEKYQFEVCEKPVVTLPPTFARTDIVILDGPFMSMGPLGESGSYVLGHVVHAIHASNVGNEPDIPNWIEPYLNRGIVRNPANTNFKKIINAGKRFIPILSHAKHIGSMYTIRAVLPDRDDTDERPTLVEEVSKNVIRIFSGKIGNCVEAAKAATALI